MWLWFWVFFGTILFCCDVESFSLFSKKIKEKGLTPTHQKEREKIVGHFQSTTREGMRKQKTGTIERRGHKIVFSPNEISERVKTLNAISSSSSSSSSSSFQNRMNIVVGNVQNVQVPREKNPWDGWWVEYEEDSQSSSSSSSSLSSSSSGKRNRDQNPNGLLYDSKECTDPRQICDPSRTKELNKYKWIPSPAYPFLDLPPFGGGKDLIDSLNGRDMFMIGDSMIRNLFESIQCQISNPSWKKRITYQETAYLCQTDPIITDGTGQKRNMYPKGPPQIEDLSKYSIVVMSTAAWYGVPQFKKLILHCQEPRNNRTCDRTTEALPRCYNLVRDYIKEKSRLHPSTLFVWKASSPWQDGCLEATEPTYDFIPNTETSFFRKQEELIFSPLSELPNFLYFDIYVMSQYRIDGHPGFDKSTSLPDCRHWCLPGIPDVWARMLQQHFSYFAKHNQTNDVFS